RPRRHRRRPRIRPGAGSRRLLRSPGRDRTELPRMIDLTFTCEIADHLVAVRDRAGKPLFAFGGFGRRPGAFDSPVDAALVSPEFFGEPPFGSVDMQYLAVADYGNARVQIFDLHGVLVTTLTDELDAIGRPCRLTWRAPLLEL